MQNEIKLIVVVGGNPANLRARKHSAADSVRNAAFFLLVVLLLSACSKPEKKAWRPGLPLDKKQVKIGVIYPNRLHGNTGWDYSHYAGIEIMRRELGLREDQIIHQFNISYEEPEVMKNVVRDCIYKGANIIITASWGFMNACEELAAEFPGVVFANAAGNKSNQSNFINYFARFYHARFLSGLAAGLKTQTNKIGYVAAMGKDNSEVTGGLNAFAIGVEQVNPDARIYVRVIHNWFDPMGETVAARFLISQGCDIIAQDSDTAAPQKAAQEAGVWGVGYCGDMSVEAPDAVLTSVIYRWEVYYIRLVRSVCEGSFTAANYLGSLSDGMVDITDLTAGLAVPGMAEKIAAGRQRIESGAFNVFDGVMETNDGGFVGEEGTTLGDSEIFDGIHWYYRNVTEATQ